MFYYSKYITPNFMSVISKPEYDKIDEKNFVIIAGFGRFGQVVGRFLEAQKIKSTILEKDPDQVERVRQFGFQGYFGDAARVEILRSAHAHKAKALVIAVDDVDSCLEIVRISKENFPNLKIFARARNRRHAYELHKLEVKYFKREMFESSLLMAQEVMEYLGFDNDEMKSKADKFRMHDEATLKKSFEFFDDQIEMISFSKQADGELEKILSEDRRID